MRTLPFTVEGQTLRKDGDFGGIISGSKGYLRCRLKIADNDDEYAMAVNADFECMVPDEVTDGRSFKVQLIGQTGKTRMKTNPVLIEQVT